MIQIVFSLFLIVHCVSGGAVGECRTECVERNQFKIVRVHLKDDFVMVGICQNTTSYNGVSAVTPFICNKKIGVWSYDAEDEEGVSYFNVFCPSNDPVALNVIEACPTGKR